MSLTVTNYDVASVWFWDPVFEDDTLVSTGAATWLKGTILGRVTASGNLTAYDPGAGDGSEIPVAVLPGEVEFDGAGTMACRPLIGGRVRKDNLVINGTTDLVTPAQADQLRDYGIIVQNVNTLSQLDNQ